MSVLIVFIQKAIVQGICILYGALGEIMTEKSGNLNLGIPGIMYMGGISGLMGAFLYEKDNPDPNALVGVLISFLCAFACAAIGGLIYSILTITLRVNQNVTGLALTIFGTGFGNFFGGSATEIFGVVGMASKSAIRDNFQALLGKENYAKGVVVKSTDAGITVDVYTVMSYGVKISEVSKNIQERVKFNLENQLGIKAETVNVYVQNIKVVGEN